MIKGLTPRMCEIGKIKIGGKGEIRKAKNGNEYRPPIKYNHFLVTTNMRDDKDILIIDKDVMKKLGENPKVIEIVLMFDDINLNFQTSYALYGGKKCLCRGDGEKAFRLDKKTGKKNEIDCDPKTCKYMVDEEFIKTNKFGCKVSGILSCLLPQAERLGGVYKFRTHSINSVLNILGALTFIQMASGGILFNLPLKLELIDKPTEEHGIVKVVNIIFEGDINKLSKQASIEMSRRNECNIDIKKIENNAVNSGILIDKDKPADVEDEFYSVSPEGIEPAGKSPEEVKEKLTPETLPEKETDTGYDVEKDDLFDTK